MLAHVPLDPLSQGRTKERLFEEELEVVWEKGGSGLVFYTDASHWDQQDGGVYISNIHRAILLAWWATSTI